MRHGLHRNTVSYFALLAMVTLAGLMLLSAIIDLGMGTPNPYLGIITYLVLPGFISLALLLFFYGMRRESLRRRRAPTDEAKPYPHLDLNDAHQRRLFVGVLLGGALLVTLLTFGAYNAFLFTETVTFCGRVCHTVMEPEYTAYRHSPHARVSCVECHVGEGASWYVRSKLSGVRQVWAVTTGDYHRPIETPVENLRPARETCEHCHWPEKFFGAQLVQNPHFRYDEANTAEQVSFLIKTGGGARTANESAGIHWHMVIDNQVRFATLDREQQKVARIWVKRRDGSSAEYESLDHKVPPGREPELRLREMDCMDCHNRPTHIFEAPDVAVDEALATATISRALPWAKREAVLALLGKYETREAAHEGIASALRGFYAAQYPELAKREAEEIERAIATVIAINDRTVFPAMKVDASTYPMHIGHRNWPGCFRCHDGRHVAKDGKVLTRDCAVCHTAPRRGPLSRLGVEAPESDASWHIWPLEGKHAEILCSRCHQAGTLIARECIDCHRLPKEAPMMASMECGDCHIRAQERTPIADCKGCHDELRGFHDVEAHADASCTDCHKPHGWVVDSRELCLTCHSDMRAHNADKGRCQGCHAFD